MIKLKDLIKEKQLNEKAYVDTNGTFEVKGFGGNNATASIYNPNFVKSLLPKIFTKSEITTYKKSLEINENNRLNYHKKCLLGDFDLLYRANEELLDPEKDIEISENYIKLKDYPKIEM